VVINYLIVGVLMLCTMLSLGELAVMYPINGAYYEYTARFCDPSWGFAIGWLYAISWMLTLPFEITAASLTVQYWSTTFNPAYLVTIYLVALIIIQVFGVRGYGEVEYVLAIIKIIACTGLIILGVIINCGGVPTQTTGYIGAKYWYNPGAFNNGFKGYCAVFVNAAFAYSGTELVGLAAAESKNPLKALPKATKQVLFRVAFFYVVNLLIVGLNVPYNNPQLLGSPGSAASAVGVDVKASPFVIAIELANIKVLPSIINAVIMMATLSVANSCTYGSTRTLQALALTGRAPKIFNYVDRKGRPLWCVVLQVAVGFIAYIQLASTGLTVFDWLLAIGSLAALIMYFSINVSHIRFRRAMKLQNRDIGEIPWKSPLGVWGSYVGAFLCALCILGVFYSALYPPGVDTPSVEGFFETFISGPFVLVLFVFWKVVKREWWFMVDLRNVDLDTGRRFPGQEFLPPPEDAAQYPLWKRAYKAVF